MKALAAAAAAAAAVIPEAVSFIVSPTTVAVTKYCAGCRLTKRYSCHDKADSLH
jgi:hypothetical protein